jgi:hypothetical protein
MKRLLAFALMLAIGSFGVLGCGEKEKPKQNPPTGGTKPPVEKPVEKPATPPVAK